MQTPLWGAFIYGAIMCGEYNPERNSELKRIVDVADKLSEKSREFASEVLKKLYADSYSPPKEMIEKRREEIENRIKNENDPDYMKKIIYGDQEEFPQGFNMQCSKNKMEMTIQGLTDGNMLYTLLNEMPDHGATEICIYDGMSIAEESSIPGVRHIRRETKIYGHMLAVDLMAMLVNYDMPTVKIEGKMIIRWINPNYK